MFNGCNSLISLPDISKWIVFDINNVENIYNDCYLLINLPEMLIKNYNDIEIIYDIDEMAKKARETRIFGKEFVDNNKNKCKLIFNNKKYELNEYFYDYNFDKDGNRCNKFE